MFFIKFKATIFYVMMILNINGQDIALKAHTGPIRSVLFINDEKVITASDDYKIKIWNPVTKFAIITQREFTSQVWKTILMKNNILACGIGNMIAVLNSTDLSTKKIFTEHSDRAWCLAVSPNNLLASGSFDVTIKIWNISLDKSLITLKGHTSSVLSVTFLSNDSIASSSADKTIKIWSITGNGTCLKTLTGHSGNVESILLLKDGYLASGAQDSTVKIWDVENSKCLLDLRAHSSWIAALIKINDSILVTGANDMTIKLWSLNDYSNFATFFVNQTGYRSLAYSSKLNILIGGHYSGFLSGWYNVSSKFHLMNSSYNSTMSLDLIAPSTTISQTTSSLVNDSTKIQTITYSTNKDLTSNIDLINSSHNSTKSFDLVAPKTAQMSSSLVNDAIKIEMKDEEIALSFLTSNMTTFNVESIFSSFIIKNTTNQTTDLIIGNF